MKISDLVQKLLATMEKYGDLEVFDYDSYSIDGVTVRVPTEQQKTEYDMTEVYCLLETFNR